MQCVYEKTPDFPNRKSEIANDRLDFFLYDKYNDK